MGERGFMGYITVEQFRKRIGYTSTQPIYRAIREGRLEHRRFGNFILIPKNAVLVDRRIKSGKYIGLKQWIDRQVSNAKDIDGYEERIKGHVPFLGDRYVDDD